MFKTLSLLFYLNKNQSHRQYLHEFFRSYFKALSASSGYSVLTSIGNEESDVFSKLTFNPFISSQFQNVLGKITVNLNLYLMKQIDLDP